MQLSAHSCQALVDELRSQQGKLTFPTGYAGRTLDSVILAFAQKYIRAFTPSYPKDVITVLDWMSSAGLTSLYLVLVERLTHSKKLTPTYISNMLIPLLPQIRTWAVQRGLLDTFAYAFQRIVAAWVDNVLGSPPAANPTLAKQLQDLSGWNCTCHQCVQAKNFLTKTADPVVHLARIGAPKRRHVEQYLSAYARGIATYSTIGGSPQGLSVSVTNASMLLTTHLRCSRYKKRRHSSHSCSGGFSRRTARRC